jgi:DNA primase
MVEQDVIPRIIVNTQGKDPDEFIRTVGAGKFDELLGHAEEYDRFFIEKFAGDIELQNPKKKREAVEGMKELIRTVGRIQDSAIRIVALSRLKQRAAKFFDIDPKTWEDTDDSPKTGAEPPEKPLHLGMAERVLLESLLAFPDLIREVREFFTQDILALLNSRNIIRQMVDLFEREGDIPLESMSRKLNETEKMLLNKLSRYREGTKTDRATAEKRVASSIISFQNKVNKKRMSDINREILVSEKESDWSRVQQLMKI